MADPLKVPTGYRQGFITAITVVITASVLFFRFTVFEPASGPWTRWGAVTAILAGLSILVQLIALWRALQPKDEEEAVYKVTLRWFACAIILLVLSLIANTVAILIYEPVEISEPVGL
jgi:hypothetical protein